MSWIAVGALAVEVGTTAYGAVSASNASGNAAQVDQAVAGYNAQVDKAKAQQIDLDTLANIQTERQNDRVYLSRGAASYASSGVLATTGSPLGAQITTAGRLEQRIQQQYTNSQQQQKELYAQATEGVAYGDAQASADRAKGSIALIDGGSRIAGQVFQGYNSGTLKFGGSTTSDPESFDG